MSQQVKLPEYAASLQDFCTAVLSADKDVAPYTRHYLGGRCNALVNTYPALRAELEPAIFDALASVYARHYPPAGWDLNLYGEQFHAFVLAQLQGAAADKFNWRLLAQVARIEYAITSAYYADDPQCDRQSPAGQPLPTPALRLEPDSELRTSWDCRQLTAQHPFVDIAPKLDLNRPIAVWRENFRVQVSSTTCTGPPAQPQSLPPASRK